MLKFVFHHMRTRLSRLVLISLSLLVTACVALLAYNISTQVSEGIIQSASGYDLILGPAGSSTQLAMNTLFFTDKPLGTIPYSLYESLKDSALVQSAVPFSMGDSYNDAPIIGTEAALLAGRPLREGVLFSQPCDAVVGIEVARAYSLQIGDQIITSHGLGRAATHAHEESPLTVTGILERTNTAFDRAVFTPCETIWALHDHHDDDDADERSVCAILIRSGSLQAYSSLMNAYSGRADLLAINPNTVLREVLENVDLSRQIVYILCAIILLMNFFIVSMIAILNAHDARKEISAMRLIGISMKNIRRIYLLENAITVLCAMLLSLIAAHGGLLLVRRFAASQGITLNAFTVYPPEWLILAAVFAVSMIPTLILTIHMARRDGLAS